MRRPFYPRRNRDLCFRFSFNGNYDAQRTLPVLMLPKKSFMVVAELLRRQLASVRLVVKSETGWCRSLRARWLAEMSELHG